MVVRGKNPEWERQIHFFSLSFFNVRPFPPSRQDAVRRCTFLSVARHRRSRSTPAPVPFLWDPRAARSFASAHAASGGTGTRAAAVQQELHSERQPAPAAAHRENPLAGFPRRPDPCALARPFLPHRPRAPQRPHSELHRALHTPLVQDLHRHTAPAPPRPPVQNARAAPTRELTPNLHTGRCWRRRDSGVGVERRREVRDPLSQDSVAVQWAAAPPRSRMTKHWVPQGQLPSAIPMCNRQW